MFDPFTIAGGIVAYLIIDALFCSTAAVVTVVYFWNDIRQFLVTTVRDIIENEYGSENAETFVDFIIWLDKKVVHAKRILETGHRGFKQKIKKLTTIYSDINETNAKKTISGSIEYLAGFVRY